MIRTLVVMLLLLWAAQGWARQMSPQEQLCLIKLREEADFLVSRIDLVHHDYEAKLKHSRLGRFKSGDYSTIGLLDNTIRKYHKQLIREIKTYPKSYKARIRTSQSGQAPCQADKLHVQAVGTIHEFELSWQKALQQAEKNARYFKRVDKVN